MRAAVVLTLLSLTHTALASSRGGTGSAAAAATTTTAAATTTTTTTTTTATTESEEDNQEGSHSVLYVSILKGLELELVIISAGISFLFVFQKLPEECLHIHTHVVWTSLAIIADPHLAPGQPITG